MKKNRGYKSSAIALKSSKSLNRMKMTAFWTHATHPISNKKRAFAWAAEASSKDYYSCAEETFNRSDHRLMLIAAG
jgi:hypothetical protein